MVSTSVWALGAAVLAVHVALYMSGMCCFGGHASGGSGGDAALELSSDLTLTYFQLRGRAEPIRLYLEANGVPYNNRMLSKDEWLAEKAEHAYDKYTFAQLPHLQNGEHSVVQMMAILAHIHRHLPVDPEVAALSSNEREAYTSKTEQYALALEDVRGAYGRLAYMQGTEEEKNAALQEYLESKMPKWLHAFEQILLKNGGFFGKGFHLVGDSLHWVDVLLWDLLDTHMHESVGGPQLLKEYPMLGRFYDTFRAHSRVAAYLESSRRSAQAHGSSAWLGARA
eukprot:TRINITY_DN3485_c0_g1_i1.p1 TRINITY_DN3485_c0_g1~~TRINITY_DN3485_c0_g1_i1.p1  ORF type:complete len:282 (-),score=93.00 TRINITY_DN3485_c0_g1_i1:389-1234(-)